MKHIIKCQDGEEDYLIRFDKKPRMIDLIKSFSFLNNVKEENLFLGFCIYSIHSSGLFRLLKSNDFILTKDIKLECEEGTTIYIDYCYENIEKILKIFNNESEKFLDHLFYADINRTVVEYHDIFCSGNLYISPHIDKTYIETFCNNLNCKYTKDW